MKIFRLSNMAFKCENLDHKCVGVFQTVTYNIIKGNRLS